MAAERRDLGDAVAPVVREYVIGYRRLRLLPGGRLASTAAGRRAGRRGIWPVGDNTAVCALGLAHEAPDAGCGCGLYALHEPPPASRSYLLAAVRGWGAVEVHASGWRAEHARVVAIATAGRPLRRERRAARRYGVPLVTEQRLVVVAAEHGDHVPDVHRPAAPAPRQPESPGDPWARRLDRVRAVGQRAYDRAARPIRATPGLPACLTTLAAKGPLLTLAVWAWLTTHRAHGGVVSDLAFALALLPALLWAVVSLVRHVFGSGIAVASPTTAPWILAAGAAAPLLFKLGAPAELTDSLALLAVFVATALLGALIATRGGALGVGVGVLLFSAVAPTLLDGRVALAPLYVMVGAGALAYVAVCPSTTVSAVVRWWRALALGSRTMKGT